MTQMNAAPLHLLIVDDEEAHGEAIRRAFASTGMEVDIRVVGTLKEYRDCIAVHPPDLALIDLNLPDGRALEVLTSPAEDAPFPILVMTAFGTQQIVVEVMKAGALDYVVKSPDSFSTIPLTVKHALREWELHQNRKQAEEAQRESENRFRTLVETGPDAIFIQIDGCFVYVNAAAVQLFGATRCEELLGRPMMDRLHPDIRDQAGERIRLLQEERKPLPAQDQVYLRLDGSPVHVNVSAVPFLYQNRNGVLVFVRDITKSKESELQLRQLSQAVEQSPNTIVITDTNGAIQYVNPKFTATTGYSFDEVIGKNPRILKSSETSPETYRDLWSNITAGCEWHGEFYNRKKNGEFFWESASISAIKDDNGVITHYLAVKEDITEKKRLTEQLLRVQRVESIGRLASGVAHDLNNILSPIMMAASILEEDIPAQTAHKELVSTIMESAQRGADIVKQVLTFARGEEGKKITLRPQLLGSQIENILRETFPKSISFSITMPDDLWMITGDLTQMHQVLLNLCLNARDAMMPNGGTLAISARNVEISENHVTRAQNAKPGCYVELKVMDSGCGIPSSVIDKIFDPFFTTKEFGRGTGLGLSTVMGIVRSHAGFMEVESHVGKGSTFSVFIPAAAKDLPASKQEENLTALKGNGETVLIIDDEPAILKVISTILTKNSYQVKTASDGIEALTTYMENPALIKVVLTDVMMPVMDGINLIRSLKRITPDARIIASSGKIEESCQKELDALGICGFLNKPFNNYQLLETVRKAMMTS